MMVGRFIALSDDTWKDDAQSTYHAEIYNTRPQNVYEGPIDFWWSDAK